MKSKKTTRRALLTSMLSLLLCVSMLVGSTFAWFTDSVTSKNNIIQSGNLDVELYYQVEGQTDWTKVTDTTNIFKENALWEPGHTEVVKLKVVNEGTLALKYQLGVNIVSETESTNVKNEPLKLSDHIKFGIVDGAQTYTRDTAVAAVDATATALNKAYSSDVIKLLPKTDTNADNVDIVTLVVYMPTTVGNEANYAKGAAVPTINLGINLYATQVEAEMDSFGNDYDEGVVYYDVLVATADELYAAVAAASDDIVIAVDGNIVLTKALSKSGLNSIKFVANSENAAIDQAIYNMHFNGAKVTFEGLALTHGEKPYGNGGQTSTAFAVWEAKEVNYIDCTFNRSVGTIHAPLHNFIRCTFNGVENPNNTKSEYPLYICDGQDYNVIDCVFNCTNRGAILFYNDGGTGVDTLNISNTKFLGDIIGDKTAVEIHNNANTQVYNVNIKNVIVGDGVINGLYRIKPGNVGEVNVTVDGVTEVAEVLTAAELKSAITNAKDNDIIYITNDITVTDKWDNRYGGRTDKAITIDGCGHTLKFTGEVNDGLNYHAVFRFTGAAVVKDLTFDFSEAAAGTYLRAISAASDLTVDNCTFIGSDNYTKDNAVMIGDTNDSAQINASATITNCTFTNWRRGVSDNENAKELKSIVISGNTFTSANVYVSAYESVSFTGNAMDDSCVNITSYTNAANTKVVVTGNTLDADLADSNVVGSASKKFTATNVTAQAGITVNVIG